MSATSYSYQNVLNSLSVYLADQLLAAGWLVYWHTLDAVQTGAGLWSTWSTSYATWHANPTFAASLAASRGILTLRGPVPANPTFITRLTSEGLLGNPDQIVVPSLCLDLDPAAALKPWELGDSGVALRGRTLFLFGYLRTIEEQKLLADHVADWFDLHRRVDVVDHAQGSGTVGLLIPTRTHIEADFNFSGPEVETFALEATVRLEYVA